MAGIWSSQDLKNLLHNKFIVVIGDSIQRGIYKDLVHLLQDDQVMREQNLRNKGEHTFYSDKLIEGGKMEKMTNGKGYKEVRQFQTDFHLLRFYYVTRCYSLYFETILADLEHDPKPDIVIMNSCLWDVSRYGPSSFEEYQTNLHKLLNRLSSNSPGMLKFWTLSPPVGSYEVASDVDIVKEVLVWAMERRRQEGGTQEGDSDSGNEDSDEDQEWCSASPSPIRGLVHCLLMNTNLTDGMPLEDLCEQLQDILAILAREGSSHHALGTAVFAGASIFLSEMDHSADSLPPPHLQELDEDFPELVEVLTAIHGKVIKVVHDDEWERSADPFDELLVKANAYASQVCHEYHIEVIDLHSLMSASMECMGPDGVHWTPNSVRKMTCHIVDCIDNNKDRIQERDIELGKMLKMKKEQVGEGMGDVNGGVVNGHLEQGTANNEEANAGTRDTCSTDASEITSMNGVGVEDNWLEMMVGEMQLNDEAVMAVGQVMESRTSAPVENFQILMQESGIVNLQESGPASPEESHSALLQAGLEAVAMLPNERHSAEERVENQNPPEDATPPKQATAGQDSPNVAEAQAHAVISPELIVNAPEPELQMSSPDSALDVEVADRNVMRLLPYRVCDDISSESGYDTPGKTPVGKVEERVIIPLGAAQPSPLVAPVEGSEVSKVGEPGQEKKEECEGAVEIIPTQEWKIRVSQRQPSAEFYSPQLAKNPIMAKVKYFTPQHISTTGKTQTETSEEDKVHTPTITIHSPPNKKPEDNAPPPSRKGSLILPDDISPVKEEMPPVHRVTPSPPKWKTGPEVKVEEVSVATDDVKAGAFMNGEGMETEEMTEELNIGEQGMEQEQVLKDGEEAAGGVQVNEGNKSQGKPAKLSELASAKANEAGDTPNETQSSDVDKGEHKIPAQEPKDLPIVQAQDSGNNHAEVQYRTQDERMEIKAERVEGKKEEEKNCAIL